jgi:hypothetical protein
LVFCKFLDEALAEVLLDEVLAGEMEEELTGEGDEAP